MLDSYNREINYLRISVTDRCNLRCIYCMPEEGVQSMEHKDCLTYEEICKIAVEASSLGIRKIRLTGGEPLVRSGIMELVSMLSKIDGIDNLSMTTNGHLLTRYADDLKKSGLTSLNISLDTLSEEKYSYLTRGGAISQVKRGIDSAIEAGFTIKINMVISQDTSYENILEMEQYCDSKSIELQKIREYALNKKKEDNTIYNRPPACSECNRIRLLSNGKLKPCLHSDEEIPLNLLNPKDSLIKAINNKPRCGSSCTTRNMVEIGG
jgi:GTP 3',8-cyclase